MAQKITETEYQHLHDTVEAYVAQHPGLTLAALSRQCLLGDGTLSEVLKGRALPTLITAQRIASGLNMEIGVLLGRVAPANEENLLSLLKHISAQLDGITARLDVVEGRMETLEHLCHPMSEPAPPLAFDAIVELVNP